MDDSQNIHLLAVTQCGVRLFFGINVPSAYQTATPLPIKQTSLSPTQNSPTKSSYGTQTSSVATPTLSGCASSLEQRRQHGLYLLHVRLPPGYTPNTTINKPKHVHSAHYNEGTLLMVSTPQQDQDILWSISSTPFLSRTYLTESTTVIPLDGIVWSLAETPNRCKTGVQSLLRKAQLSKKVVLLTNQGAHIVSSLKPIDILKQLLIACHGPHHEAVKAYFQVKI